MERREHPQLAARQHSIRWADRIAGVLQPAEQLLRWRRRSTSASTRRTIRRRACSSTTNFPGASTANLNEARALYALLTGRVQAIPGTARLDAATGKYVYNGDLAQKSRQTLFAAYVQDSWRDDADADLECRSALGPPPAVHRRSTPTLLARAAGRYLRHLRHRHRAGRPAVQPLQAGHADRQGGPDLYGLRAGHAGVQHELDELRAQRRRRVAHRTRSDGLPPDAPRRSRAGDDPRRLRDELQPGAHRPLHGNAGNNPGGTINVTRNTDDGLPARAARARASRCCSARRTASARRRSRDAGVSDHGDDGEQRQHVPAGSDGPARALLLGRVPALDRPATWRSKCATSATGTCTVGRGELERAEHHRERLPRRVQARAGQPQGQHRGRPRQHVRLHGRAGHLTAADPPRLPQRPRRRGQHGAPTRQHELHQRGVPRPAQRDRAGSARRRQRRWTRPRSAPTRPRPALPVELLRDEPGRRPARSSCQDRDYTKFNSLQLEVRRRLSKGLLVSGNYTYGIRKGVAGTIGTGTNSDNYRSATSGSRSTPRTSRTRSR